MDRQIHRRGNRKAMAKHQVKRFMYRACVRIFDWNNAEIGLALRHGSKHILKAVIKRNIPLRKKQAGGSVGIGSIYAGAGDAGRLRPHIACGQRLL